MDKLTIRLPEGMHRALKREALERDLTLQTYVVPLLTRRSGPAVEKQDEPVKPKTDLPERDTDRGARVLPPTPKPCRKQAFHHIYHSGKPCPECGYPLQ